jgi:hypothetical protein
MIIANNNSILQAFIARLLNVQQLTEIGGFKTWPG